MANWFQLVFQMQAKLSYSTRLVLFFFFATRWPTLSQTLSLSRNLYLVYCILYLVSCTRMWGRCWGSGAQKRVTRFALTSIYLCMCLEFVYK